MDARRVSTLEADGILDLGVDRFDERRILSWAAAELERTGVYNQIKNLL